MKRARQPLVLGLTSLLGIVLLRRSISFSLKQAVRGWKTNPAKMCAKLVLSLLTGQVVFWRFGYDQLGLFMTPKKQIGYGQELAERIYPRLPPTKTAAWIIKILEIVTDAGKIPIEGAAYARHGFAPDLVAGAVTQPLWSTLETAEKISGAVLYPERVNHPDQVKLSIGCIYGSLFRYVLASGVWVAGGVIYRIIGRPLEAGFRTTFRATQLVLPHGSRT